MFKWPVLRAIIDDLIRDILNSKGLWPDLKASKTHPND